MSVNTCTALKSQCPVRLINLLPKALETNGEASSQAEGGQLSGPEKPERQQGMRLCRPKLIHEELEEAMERDCQVTMKMLWQSRRRIRQVPFSSCVQPEWGSAD